MNVPLIRIAAALTCASTAMAADALTMRPLFNGKDLTGWKGAGYSVENGAIVCTPFKCAACALATSSGRPQYCAARQPCT